MSYCIIVPCFNEGKRILINDYLEFVNQNPDFHLLFVDDGSTDNTYHIIDQLSKQSENIQACQLKNNSGKAEAIRYGINKVINEECYDKFGYLDADLAIPFSEVLRLKTKLEEGYDFAFSSKKITEDSNLEYKFKRYFIGRVLSLMVRASLKTKIYDTQCGCKLMTRELARVAFAEKFINPWLFDIEIIWRMILKLGKSFMQEKMIEVPVKRLIDRGSSRIKATDLLSLPFDFLKIHLHYTKHKKSNK